jgi:ribosome maturation protein SDO1
VRGRHREKDLNEVVQTTTIFANVSKGVLAKHEDMSAVFGSTDEDAICRRILQDGDLQVTEP